LLFVLFYVFFSCYVFGVLFVFLWGPFCVVGETGKRKGVFSLMGCALFFTEKAAPGPILRVGPGPPPGRISRGGGLVEFFFPASQVRKKVSKRQGKVKGEGNESEGEEEAAPLAFTFQSNEKTFVAQGFCFFLEKQE
jgi:hypothetical protein